MDLQRIFVTLTLESPGAALSEFVPIFHRFIQERVLPEMLIDVATYEHVKGGAVLLIGHEADYRVSSEPLCLTYCRKRLLEGSPAKRIELCLTRALAASRILSQHGYLCDENVLQLEFADRLWVENTPASFEALSPHVLEAAQKALGAVDIEYIEADRRAPLKISITRR